MDKDKKLDENGMSGKSGCVERDWIWPRSKGECERR